MTHDVIAHVLSPQREVVVWSYSVVCLCCLKIFSCHSKDFPMKRFLRTTSAYLPNFSSLEYFSALSIFWLCWVLNGSFLPCWVLLDMFEFSLHFWVFVFTLRYFLTFISLHFCVPLDSWVCFGCVGYLSGLISITHYFDEDSLFCLVFCGCAAYFSACLTMSWLCWVFLCT